jgi:GWxTD domain-containing protein
MAGVLVFHLRSLAGWVSARRLCNTGVCCAPDVWQEQLGRLRLRMRVSRPVALLESGLAAVPAAVGYLRPVILVPAGLLAGLPAGQVEAILLHELAHIRRCDYLINLLQTFVEGLLFYHPAVWWISGVIRSERENCCDDLVVATHGDPHEYAAALTALEASRSAVPVIALAATEGSLVKRIRRLLVPTEVPRTAVTPAFAAMILTAATAVGLMAWQAKPADATAAPPPPGVFANWLNQDVAYVITDAERLAFKNLRTDEEREHFVAQFWDRRNPIPNSAENPAKREHYRRIQYANAHFSTATTEGWKTDRGRIYITYGPPDEIESHPTGGLYVRPAQEGGGTVLTYAFEQWGYGYVQGLGNSTVIEFVDRSGTGDYRIAANPFDKEMTPDGSPVKPNPAQALDTGANRTGATVKVPGNGIVQMFIPLTNYGESPLTIAGRLLTSDHRVAATFEETVQRGGPAMPVYAKVLSVQPGKYHLYIAVRNTSTNALYSDGLSFEVK